MNQVKIIPFSEIGLIRPLFQQVFGADISDVMLEWKYGGGRGRSYGFFSSTGQLLAHCGVFYRSVQAEGQRRRIAQLGDLMAAPGKVGGLSRSRSPFALLVKQVLEDLPEEDNPDALAFGFPSDRAMRLGEYLGLFTSIDQMWELKYSPLPSSWRTDRCVVISRPDSIFHSVADRLWEEMVDGLGNNLLGIRDGDYLEQRYFRHPSFGYHCHLVLSRWLGRPLGIIITRMDGEQCELLDLIAPPDHMERILRTARRQMPAWGVERMSLWLTERHAKPFKEQADAVQPLEFRIMANPFSSMNNPQRFASRWWLTSGDTDYH